MKIKRAKLKIVRFLIFALLLCSFSFKPFFVSAEEVGVIEFSNYLDGNLNGPRQIGHVYDSGNGYQCEISIWHDEAVFSGVSFSPSLSFTYVIEDDESGYPVIIFYFGDSWDSSITYTADLYYESRLGPTPTPTRGPTDTPTPTPWAEKTYGQSGGADTVSAYLRSFNGSYRYGSDEWFQPSSTSLKINIIAPGVSGRVSGDIPLPFPYKLDVSKFPVNANIAAEGYTNSGWVGSFSAGNADGTVLHFEGLGWPVQWSGGRNMYIATITMTPSPTLSPTPTITPYPSAAPATFSTYTINFVAPNGYIVGTVRPVLSIGSSYSGAISALTFSFLDGWFSYGDEVDGEKGSFTWDYSYSENFGEYLWHFSTSSWPASESINIPVYRLDGEYPEVVPDLNNVSDLFDTIGKSDPQNFSWFYDGLQAFIDINWSWAYLMLLFPLFVMLWAFFRRH